MIIEMIRITEREHLHLLEVSHNRAVITGFGPGGVFLSPSNDEWIFEEIAKLRGLTPVTPNPDDNSGGSGSELAAAPLNSDG